MGFLVTNKRRDCFHCCVHMFLPFNFVLDLFSSLNNYNNYCCYSSIILLILYNFFPDIDLCSYGVLFMLLRLEFSRFYAFFAVTVEESLAVGLFSPSTCSCDTNLGAVSFD